jgi:hypothetical protein
MVALTDLQKRMALFLIGCLGMRSLIAYGAKIAPAWLLPWLGWAALVPAAGFLWIWATGARKSGPEVFGSRIWWNALRPLHATLYIAFAIAAIGWQSPNAWKILAADVVIGLAAFIWHHAATGSFRKIL